MKTRKISKFIIFTLLSVILLIFVLGVTKSHATELDVDTSFDAILASIDNILAKNEKTEKLDHIIQNVKFSGVSRTSRIFCKENNDTQIKAARDNRVARVEKIINLHKINFLTANFNLL